MKSAESQPRVEMAAVAARREPREQVSGNEETGSFLFLVRHCAAPFTPGPEQDDRANHRHDESSRMKCRTGCRFGEDPSDQTTDDRSGDAEDRGHDKSHLLCAGQNPARTQADNETNNDRPNDV